jgi:hypothetical protein
MSNFHIFEHAYKKALSNGRRPRDAVQYGLKKYVLHIIDDYKFYAEEETQQCFVDEAFKVYCDERHADDTHGDAARAAIQHIHRTFKDAKKARCNHCGKADTSSHAETFTRRSSFKSESSARGKPKYNYDDPRNINGQASSTCAKPAHNNANLRNNEFPSSAHTRAPERRSSCKKDRPQHNPFDFEDMFDTLPETSRDSESCRKDRRHARRDSCTSRRGSDHCKKDRRHEHSRRDSYSSRSRGGESYAPRAHGGRENGGHPFESHSRHRHDDENYDCASHHGRSDRHHDEEDFFHSSHHGCSGRHNESDRPWPPMPAGFGRFKFHDPIFTDDCSDGCHSSFSTHEFRPSDYDFNTRGFRPGNNDFFDRDPFSSKDGLNTREFKSSGYGDETPRHSRSSSRPSEYDYEYSYSSSQRSPPLRHKSFRPSSDSYSRRGRPSPCGIKPSTCLYTVLNISRSASADEIKTAYRKMSMKHHPDRAAGAYRARATAKMAEINQANDVLGDVVKRRYYDRTGCLPGVLD